MDLSVNVHVKTFSLFVQEISTWLLGKREDNVSTFQSKENMFQNNEKKKSIELLKNK